MPPDWQTRYGYRPLLLETLVDTQRFRGTCYRAANWIHFRKPPDVDAWTGRTLLTVKRSKISMFIRWGATPASSYA